ncbi:MAG: T9SS type A sorting domain-containing protein [Candidatus Latescibacteria bacterium]|nr:T9SS type A sorting domain-containing protein [Candidatus Latescibacterota bacterium]
MGGHFLDVRLFAGLGHLRSIGSVAPADFDNDGDTDWYATRVVETVDQGNILFENQGDGTVIDIAARAGVRALGRPTRTFGGVTFFDYNEDSHLDLLVPNGAGADFFFVNQGEGTFVESSMAAGLGHPHPTSGPAAGDYDGDGRIDLFTSIGGQPDALYCNQGDGTFVNKAAAAGIDHAPEWGLSSARFVDVDNDGDLDLYGISGDLDFAHIFYRNQGDGTFSEAADEAGLRGRKAASLGLVSGDFDNDGWVDMLVSVVGEANFLYFNDGDGTFTDRVVDSGLPIMDAHDDLVASSGDYNGDGFLDLFVNNFDFAPVNALFVNGGNANGWLHIDLVGTQSNRSAIGARVRVQAGELDMLRHIGRGETLLVEFGLGSHGRAEQVEVEWPSGQRTLIEDVKADQRIRIFEDRPGYFPVQPTLWVETPLDSAVVGAQVPVRAQVRVAPFEDGATVAAIAADLSALGGPAVAPLEALGEGVFQLNEVVIVAPPHGLKFVPVRIEQTTSLGPYRTTLTAAVAVSPAADRPIYRQGLEADWRLEANARVDIEPQAMAPEGRTAMQMTGEGRVWRVEYSPAAPIEPVGYQALRLSFHPGDAVLPALGPRFSAHINLGGQIASLFDLGVDLTRREWQEITVPMEALNVELPIEFIRLTGNLNGTFFVDDVRLVAATPRVPTAIAADYDQSPAIELALEQNFPNPFNSGTVIRFALSMSQEAELAIYNLAGQKVATLTRGMLSAGVHAVPWQGHDERGRMLASGLYLYRLQAGDRIETRKLLMVR